MRLIRQLPLVARRYSIHCRAAADLQESDLYCTKASPRMPRSPPLKLLALESLCGAARGISWLVAKLQPSKAVFYSSGTRTYLASP
jgi:hypothetical protein